MEVTKCLLTGVRLEQPATASPDGGTYCVYNNELVGKVNIALPTIVDFQSRNEYKHPVLAAICRNAFEWSKEPPLITQNYISEELEKIAYPKTLREKAAHLLKYVYDKGGRDFVQMMFQADKDYPICYANDVDEFDRVMKYLVETKHWLSCELFTGVEEGGGFYFGTTLTELGIEEVENSSPREPRLPPIMVRGINSRDPLGDLHPTVQRVATKLFEDGHFRQAILDTYITLVEAVRTKSGLDLDGVPLMNAAFSARQPVLSVSTDSDERLGFMWLFTGAVMGIRNPKAHRIIEQTDPQRALEWLSFASVLFRVLDDSTIV